MERWSVRGLGRDIVILSASFKQPQPPEEEYREREWDSGATTGAHTVRVYNTAALGQSSYPLDNDRSSTEEAVNRVVVRQPVVRD